MKVKSKMGLNEATHDSTETLAKVKYNGNVYKAEGIKSHTRAYNWEEVEIYENGYDLIGHGLSKWQGRPWQKFPFANALIDAVVDWFGPQAKNGISEAVDCSNNCQEALDLFIDSFNKKISMKDKASMYDEDYDDGFDSTHGKLKFSVWHKGNCYVGDTDDWNEVEYSTFEEAYKEMRNLLSAGFDEDDVYLEDNEYDVTLYCKNNEYDWY